MWTVHDMWRRRSNCSWYLRVIAKNQLSVVSLLRDWTAFSVRSAIVLLLSNKCTGNWHEISTLFETFFYSKHLCNRNSDKKYVICTFFYRSENVRYIFQFWQSNVWLLSVTIILFFANWPFYNTIKVSWNFWIFY
jgi:hypothetical protein